MSKVINMLAIILKEMDYNNLGVILDDNIRNIAKSESEKYKYQCEKLSDEIIEEFIIKSINEEFIYNLSLIMNKKFNINNSLDVIDEYSNYIVEIAINKYKQQLTQSIFEELYFSLYNELNEICC